METATPKVIKDGLRMLRYRQEGAQTLRGDPIMDEIGAWDSFLQGIGFRPGQLVNRMDANRALKNLEQRILDRKRHLLNRYALSVRMQDPGMRKDTLAAIQRFNKANPTVAITPATLKRSLTARARASSQARHGIFISRSLQGLEREVRFGVSDPRRSSTT